MAKTDPQFGGWREYEQDEKWIRLLLSPVAIPPGYEFREARKHLRLKHLVIKVFPTGDQHSGCPVCNAELVKNGLKHPRFKGISHGSLRVTFMVVRQQYRCKGEKKHYSGEALPGLDPKHHCFATVGEYILDQADRTAGAVACAIGFSDKTASAFLVEHAARIAARQYDAVYWGLGVDEKYLDDGLPHFVMIDLLSGQFIVMLRDNTKETICEELRKFGHLDKVFARQRDVTRRSQQRVRHQRKPGGEQASVHPRRRRNGGIESAPRRYGPGRHGKRPKAEKPRRVNPGQLELLLSDFDVEPEASEVAAQNPAAD